MPDGLYERDVLEWSGQQADLLRRLAAGERVNAAIDWTNVIEEVGDVGRSELHACESLLAQALVHLLKLHAWPGSSGARHWETETRALLTDAKRRYTPAMRQRIDLCELYADALYRLSGVEDDSGPPRSLSPECPLALDDLIASRPDIRALTVRFIDPERGGDGRAL